VLQSLRTKPEVDEIVNDFFLPIRDSQSDKRAPHCRWSQSADSEKLNLKGGQSG
jgi:hypothetical protein